MFAEELHAMFERYRVTGMPQMPDQLAPCPSTRGADWPLSLTPREGALMRRSAGAARSTGPSGTTISRDHPRLRCVW